jgi:hypothetical protein
LALSVRQFHGAIAAFNRTALGRDLPARRLGRLGAGIASAAIRWYDLAMADAAPPPVEDLNGAPLVDENGVDLSLIEYCLRLTPLQRLRAAQAAANTIMKFRRLNGHSDEPWQTPLNQP